MNSKLLIKYGVPRTRAPSAPRKFDRDVGRNAQLGFALGAYGNVSHIYWRAVTVISTCAPAPARAATPTVVRVGRSVLK